MVTCQGKLELVRLSWRKRGRGANKEAKSRKKLFKAGEKEEAKEYFYSLVEKGALSAENQTVWREAYRLYTNEDM